MKLIIQIPCLNEAATLESVLRDLPTQLDGVDVIETLVLDDGSSDNTSEVARRAGARHIVRFPRTLGLARTFMAGLDACLELGADVIVNTDGDHQYRGEDIVRLIAPILAKEADLVIGERDIEGIDHFSPTKKILQRWGSWVVRQLSDTTVPDATSGFRAYSRAAALQLNVITDFTYTLETIIQAGKIRMAIGHVPVGTNPVTRPSRIMSSLWGYIKKSASTLVRIYTAYEPLKVFGLLGGVLFAAGVLISLRYMFFYLSGFGMGHLQSLILSAVLMILGFQIGLIGLVADAISANRRLLESLLRRLRNLELSPQGRGSREGPPGGRDAGGRG